MKYRFKGFAGKWNVYDEAGVRVGSVCYGTGRTPGYEYQGEKKQFSIHRQGNQVSVERGHIPWLSGYFVYPVDKNGTVVQESPFRPPMPKELKLEGAGGSWSLHQLPNRDIEVFYRGQRAGLFEGMAMGKKTLEWIRDTSLLGTGLLCFALGLYMIEDDTIYIV